MVPYSAVILFQPILFDAEVQLSDTWKVCAGDESKEVDIQNKRIRRERETIYRTVQEIPSNPKEPWDREMDPDDTLTTEIPIEQLPDTEGAETGVLPLEDRETEAALASMPNGITPTAEPDVELLAILLKNPELVYALTSGEVGNLSSEQTVKLLDSIKANGMNSLSIQTNLTRDAERKVEVSLPSPTPSSDPGTVRYLVTFCTDFKYYGIWAGLFFLHLSPHLSFLFFFSTSSRLLFPDHFIFSC